MRCFRFCTGGPRSGEGAPGQESSRAISLKLSAAGPSGRFVGMRGASILARMFLVRPVLRPLALTGLVLIFTVFMLTKRFDLTHRLPRLVGLGQINIMTQALDDAAQRVSRYLLMQVLVNASDGLCRIGYMCENPGSCRPIWPIILPGAVFGFSADRAKRT